MKKEHRYCDICEEDCTEHSFPVHVPYKTQRDPADGEEHLLTKEVDLCPKCSAHQVNQYFAHMGMEFGADFLKECGIHLT